MAYASGGISSGSPLFAKYQLNVSCVKMGYGIFFREKMSPMIALILLILATKEVAKFAENRKSLIVQKRIESPEKSTLLQSARPCISRLRSLNSLRSLRKLHEPRHEISNTVVCATSKGSDQPAHTRSLIRAFASHLNILGLLSY